MDKMKLCFDYDIINGPSKSRVFDACEYADDEIAKVPVEFTIVAGYSTPVGDEGCACFPLETYNMKIYGISHGKAGRLLLEGTADAVIHDSTSPKKGMRTNYKFRACYNHASRKGKISFFLD